MKSSQFSLISSFICQSPCTICLKKKNKQNKTTKIYSMIISSYFSVSLSVGESLGDTGDFMLVLFTVTFCMRPGLVCMR